MMESVSKARERFAKFPIIFAKCAKPGSVYAKCVLLNEELKKDVCVREFQEFTACLKTVAKEMKTRI